MRKITIEERAIALARYIIETQDTVRSTSQQYTKMFLTDY